jgi:ABC-type glycerol-3-phosphate transport system substrate-binding protein
MKTKRFLLAVAVTMAAAACSADVTAPDPTLRAPAGAQNVEATAASTTQPPAPTEPVEGDGGHVGSGVGR